MQNLDLMITKDEARLFARFMADHLACALQEDPVHPLTAYFDSDKLPSLSFEAYLHRFQRYLHLPTYHWIHATGLLYLAIESKRIRPQSPHRLWLAAVSITIYVLEDITEPIAQLARLGGVSVAELQCLIWTLVGIFEYSALLERPAVYEMAGLLEDSKLSVL